MRSIRSNQTKMNLSRTVAHKGQCNKKWFAANKKDRMQTKKIGCEQKNQNLSRRKQKRICKLKRKWNNVERARADTRLAIFRVDEAN